MITENKKRILAVVAIPFVLLWCLGSSIWEILIETGSGLFEGSYSMLWGHRKTKLKNPQV